MSTPEQREATRLKVARWRALNKDKLKARADRANYLRPATPRGQRPGWRCVEWLWPDGSAFSGLPLACCVIKADQTWRDATGLPRAVRSWFDVFRSVGVAPVESHLFVPTITMNLTTARACCRLRIATIVGGYDEPPEWLVT